MIDDRRPSAADAIHDVAGDRDKSRSPRREDHSDVELATQPDGVGSSNAEVKKKQALDAALEKMVLESVGTLPPVVLTRIRDLIKQFQKDTSKALSAHKRHIDIQEDIKLIDDGRWPAGIRPWKSPYITPELMDKLSANGDPTRFEVEFPAVMSIGEAKELLYIQYQKKQKQLDGLVAAKQLQNARTATNFDLFVRKSVSCGTKVVEDIVGLPIEVPTNLFTVEESITKAKVTKFYKEVVLKLAAEESKKVADTKKKDDAKEKMLTAIQKLPPEDLWALAAKQAAKDYAKQSDPAIAEVQKHQREAGLKVDFLKREIGHNTSEYVTEFKGRRFTKKELAERKIRPKNGNSPGMDQGLNQNTKGNKGKGKGSQGKGGRNQNPSNSKGKGKGKGKGGGKGKGKTQASGSRQESTKGGKGHKGGGNRGGSGGKGPAKGKSKGKGW